LLFFSLPTLPPSLSVQSIERFKTWKAIHPTASPAEAAEELERCQRVFNSLKSKDCKLIKVCMSIIVYVMLK
jgi:hypothetical protein